MSDAARAQSSRKPAAGRSTGPRKAVPAPELPKTSPKLDDLAQTTSAPFPTLQAGDVAAMTGLYRVLKPDGSLVDPERDPGVADDDALAMLRTMVRVRALDERMLGLQRQGRIGFYGAATGQEAATIAAGHALELRDWVHPALREGGMLLHRGWPLWSYLAACFGNADDTSTRGRQMPCHYGSRQYNYVTLSSVMATQYPQAVGTAYAMALLHEAPDRPVCLGCIGDGATSEGDFHAALTMAGVLRPKGLGLPLVLYCQNNQWAISTPVEKQTAAPSLASKALGYGIAGARVDGNDALAVLQVMRAAVDQARRGGVPVFVEAVTYRVGAHSTSDDPTRYRDEGITQQWKALDPIARLGGWLQRRGVLADGDLDAMLADADQEVRTTLAQVEQVPPPPLDALFEDVYATVPPHLAQQRAALTAHLARKSANGHG
jgi:pyruvate dehydrogenase E1 component alpha subunit/2-oxoisovalerate dehydrogenase E1 component alpha subunit